MRRKYPAIAIAAAMRLVEFLGRDGECDPHRKTMAAELGQCERQISRGYAVLEADGWIMRRRGGRDDAVIIMLMIPPDDADARQFGANQFDAIRANKVARMDRPHTGHLVVPYAGLKGTRFHILKICRWDP
jgi:hypothetical protein